MSALITLDKITYQLPYLEKIIIKQLSLEVDQGEFLVILGHNGSGKSSLIKLLSKELEASEGKLYFNKKSYSKLSYNKLSQDIAILRQELSSNLFTELTVYENCLLATKAGTISKNELKGFLLAFNPRLSSMLDKTVNKLSGGEKQTLALALCFLKKPRLLLLDEHTSALDPKIADRLIKLTLEQAKKEGITVVMTTHNLKHVSQCANRVIALKEGSLIFDKRVENNNPLSQEEVLSSCF
ncbi:MAG: ATP-binding cassette domain-containing protein [Chlamydiales bacterium]|nr:ATP-binding cassette domain-containing protein [Chlamydiales bacterium]